MARKSDNKRKVCMLVASGMKSEQIAQCMGISIDDLEGSYAIELRDGAALFLGDFMDMLDKAARTGNVTAMKLLDNRIWGAHLKPQQYVAKKEVAANVAAIIATESDWAAGLKQ